MMRRIEHILFLQNRSQMGTHSHKILNMKKYSKNKQYIDLHFCITGI